VVAWKMSLSVKSPFEWKGSKTNIFPFSDFLFSDLFV
jgi:hypothetical protein